MLSSSLLLLLNSFKSMLAPVFSVFALALALIVMIQAYKVYLRVMFEIDPTTSDNFNKFYEYHTSLYGETDIKEAATAYKEKRDAIREYTKLYGEKDEQERIYLEGKKAMEEFELIRKHQERLPQYKITYDNGSFIDDDYDDDDDFFINP